MALPDSANEGIPYAAFAYLGLVVVVVPVVFNICWFVYTTIPINDAVTIRSIIKTEHLVNMK